LFPQSEYEIEFDFMSKLLNIGKNIDEKRNSDHSDNEGDDDFKRAMFYQDKVKVDVTLWNRKLHRRRKLKENGTNRKLRSLLLVTELIYLQLLAQAACPLIKTRHETLLG
jgi:hypothetical protein